MLAINFEEDDARIYGTFADRLRESYSDTVRLLEAMRDDKMTHANRLLQGYGAAAVAGVALELAVISWIRHRFMDTPLLSVCFQVVICGVLAFIAGILIGSA